MLTNPRDAFRGQSNSPNMVPFDVTYGFLSVCYNNFVPRTHSFMDIRFQKYRYLETPLGLTQAVKLIEDASIWYALHNYL